MPTPIMVTTGTSVTGDLITGTAVKLLVRGMPVATMTAPVSGAACTGLITATTAVNKLVMGLPMANITSAASGVNPATGAPVTTTAMATTGVNIIV